MKTLFKVILISTLSVTMFTGCGGSSGGKKKTKPNNQYQPPHNGNHNGQNNGHGTPGRGSNQTPTTPGVTPYAHAQNTFFPRADLYLSFDKDGSGGVYAEGELDLAQQFGSNDCTMPVGVYDVSTLNPGSELTIVHNYGNVGLDLDGPVQVRALLENSYSMQNQNGYWVMHATLVIQSVSNSNCQGSPLKMTFSMPLAN
jgi:hypothetical protein